MKNPPSTLPTLSGETPGPARLERLCLHTITTRPWNLETASERYAAAGLKGITVWRDALNGRDPGVAGRRLRDLGLEVVSLCRGGFFAHREVVARTAAIDENCRALDEAAALGAPLLVMVCGADPGQSLEESRSQIRDGLAALLPRASERGVKLALEPLHPMYADSRSAINTLRQANDMVESLASPWVGVAVDVYHLWWDPELMEQIARCGSLGALLAYHVCDWKTPTVDLLNDRGLMGEGCIPLRRIRQAVAAAGFRGYNEVEIFSNRYWAGDQDQYLSSIVRAYLDHV